MCPTAICRAYHRQLHIGLLVAHAVARAAGDPSMPVEQCTVGVDPPTLERFGGDYKYVALRGENATVAACGALCCSEPRCDSFSYNHPVPGSGLPEKCPGEGEPRCGCCQLKAGKPKLKNNTYGLAVRTGFVTKPPPPPIDFPTPPYENSTFITGCTLDRTHMQKPEIQGDTWPSTWAADGQSYAMGCDNKPPSASQMNWMNWWMVDDRSVGGPGNTTINLTLVNQFPVPHDKVLAICGHYFRNDTRKGNIKPSSAIAIGNTLYVGAQCMTYSDDGDHHKSSFVGRQRCWNTWLITSSDGGVSWNWTATPFDFFVGKLTNPMFINAGKGYEDAPDSYIYVHFPASSGPDTNGGTAYWDGNDYILLGRVPTDQILNRSAYEFWTGSLTSAGSTSKQLHSTTRTGTASEWSPDESQAKPHFAYLHMTGQDHSFYSAKLKRYIIPNYGFVDPRTGRPVGWHEEHSATGATPVSQLTMYESEYPMGPWQLFYRLDQWNYDAPLQHGGYSADFPQQWISADGKTMRMVGSACCGGTGYTYHATEMQLQTNDTHD